MKFRLYLIYFLMMFIMLVTTNIATADSDDSISPCCEPGYGISLIDTIIFGIVVIIIILFFYLLIKMQKSKENY